MKIYLGADHGGYAFKNKLAEHLKKAGYKIDDEGDDKLNPDDDFPVFAGRVVTKVLASSGKDDRGILLCRSGQGMCMAANRFKGIRAALGWSKDAARSTRNDDDSNVLCLPVDDLKEPELIAIAELWLNTPFAGAARYTRRIRELDNLN